MADSDGSHQKGYFAKVEGVLGKGSVLICTNRRTNFHPILGWIFTMYLSDISDLNMGNE